MSLRDLLTEDELAAVREATQRAEARSGGEVVVVVVDRSASGQGETWKGAAIGALAGPLGVGLAHQVMGLWGSPIAALGPVPAGIGAALPALLGATLGALAAMLVPPIARLLAGSDELDQRVLRRAEAAFLEEEVFATKDRTGVLILVSQYEHRVRIIADSGIHAKVPAEVWATISGALARELGGPRPARALVTAVDAVGGILAEHGVPRRGDDRDELADGVRFRE